MGQLLKEKDWFPGLVASDCGWELYFYLWVLHCPFGYAISQDHTYPELTLHQATRMGQIVPAILREQKLSQGDCRIFESFNKNLDLIVRSVSSVNDNWSVNQEGIFLVGQGLEEKGSHATESGRRFSQIFAVGSLPVCRQGTFVGAASLLSVASFEDSGAENRCWERRVQLLVQIFFFVGLYCFCLDNIHSPLFQEQKSTFSLSLCSLRIDQTFMESWVDTKCRLANCISYSSSQWLVQRPHMTQGIPIRMNHDTLARIVG